MTEDKFKWDENNVTELLYHLSKKTNWVHSQMCKWAEDFKQSKLQSQDKQIGWEIVEFKTKDGHLAIKQSEPRFGLHWRVMKGESIGWCSYSTCIEDYNIHSVKRLSDGEVFTIGDEVRYKLNPKSPFIITNFLVKGTDILARSEGNNICEFVDDNLEKTPKPSSIDRIEVKSIPNKQDEIRIAELEKELDVTESLLNERQRILDAIPECEAHGKCVPHALDWVEMKKSKIYSQSEVDTIREETWKAARETTFSFKGEQDFPNPKIKYPTLQDYLNSLSKETKPKEEDKPVIIEDNDRCGICGGEMVYIRGRYPNTDKRKVCPTCTTERLEQISDLCSPEYGKAYQNKN